MTGELETTSKQSQRLTPLAVVAVAVCLLMIPVLINRMPFLYPDSLYYLWNAYRDEFPQFRPTLYAWFLKETLVFEVPKFPIFLQALLTVTVLFRFYYLSNLPRTLATTMVLFFTVGVFSSLPWVTCYLMPDFSTAVLAVSLAALFFFADRFKEIDWHLFLFATGGALVLHASNLPITLLAMGIGVVFFRKVPGKSLLRVLGVVLLSQLVLIGTNGLLHKRLSLNPTAVLFPAARSFGNGPLRWYLEDECLYHNEILCDDLRRMTPLSTIQVLWWNSGGLNAFEFIKDVDTNNPRLRQVLLSAMQRYPFATLRFALENAWDQLVYFDLSDVLYTGWTFEDVLYASAPASAFSHKNMKHSIQMQDTDPADMWLVILFNRVLSIWFWVSMGGTIALLLFRPAVSLPIQRAVCFLLSLVLVNALVCGVLSDAVSRYQLRIIWLAPFCFSLLCVALWKSRKDLPTSFRKEYNATT